MIIGGDHFPITREGSGCFYLPQQSWCPSWPGSIRSYRKQGLRVALFLLYSLAKIHFSFLWNFSFLRLYLMVSRQGVKLTFPWKVREEASLERSTCDQSRKRENQPPHLGHERKRIAWLWVWAPVPEQWRQCSRGGCVFTQRYHC